MRSLQWRPSSRRGRSSSRSNDGWRGVPARLDPTLLTQPVTYARRPGSDRWFGWRMVGPALAVLMFVGAYPYSPERLLQPA